jgi:N-acetylneuraminic acid mutarotase
MNCARKGAASCTLGGAVYVFCGFGSDTMPMSSVEMLTDAGSTPELLESWKLIYIPEAVLTPRWLPAVVALNDNEIVIMGGCTYEDDEVENMGDVILFNVGTEEAQKIIKNYAGLL